MDLSTTTFDFSQLTIQIGALLKSYTMQLTTAESCSGGGVAQAITAIPGSSAWFERGFITYSNESKQELLGVRAQTLLVNGAVSEQTALEMAKGALSHSPAHISLAVTGIAGPEGGTTAKPLGTVWIAWAAKGAKAIAKEFQFSGDRHAVRQQAIYSALSGLLAILNLEPNSPRLLPPVITLDGPSGTGKGTLSQLIAQRLGWHYLDSGASFRVLAYAALSKGVRLHDDPGLQVLAKTLNFEFVEHQSTGIQILLEQQDVTGEIRTETCGNAASKIATLPAVRQALLERQRAFRKWPGLVTDGRDMGTVIFPDAAVKFYLHASATERAKRRLEQLKKAGVPATLEAILQDLEERDKRDQDRGIAPLKPAVDALVVDTTKLSIATSLAELMHCVMAAVFSSNHC